MPPALAAAVVSIFVLHCLRADLKQRSSSPALWIPLVWMFLAGSRSVAEWLNLGTPAQSLDVVENNPLNTAVFQLLVAAGIIVLLRRKVAWRALLFRNKWVWAFFLFGAISAVWSPYPWISTKRLVKAFGNVVMALVILTDKRPFDALGAVFARLSLVTLPLSVLFIRYYSELGRTYHMGSPSFTGVSTQKNGLGQLCLLAGIYACWNLLYGATQRVTVGGPLRIRMELVTLAMVAWLITMADSATSFVCLFVAACLFVFSRIPLVARVPRRVLRLGLVGLVLIAALELTFDVRNTVLAALNRDPTLTTRVPMWEDLLGTAPSPLLGTGFETYWATPVGRALSARWFGVIQAHNEYLQIYLNLGLVGLSLLLGSMVGGVPKIARQLSVYRAGAMLRLAFLVVVMLYGWTEATFRGASNPWLLLLLAIIEVPAVRHDESDPKLPPSAEEQVRKVACTTKMSWGSDRATHKQAVAQGARDAARVLQRD